MHPFTATHQFLTAFYSSSPRTETSWTITFVVFISYADDPLIFPFCYPSSKVASFGPSAVFLKVRHDASLPLEMGNPGRLGLDPVFAARLDFPQNLVSGARIT